MHRLLALLPRSLLSRVMLLYMAALSLLLGAGVTVFAGFELDSSVEDAEHSAQALSSLLSPALAEAAVIGDYDTIQRTLERVIAHPLFERAAFIDLKGSRLEVVRQDLHEPRPPEWLIRHLQERLGEVNTPISAGGRDYGIVRLTLWHEHVAADVWQVLRLAPLLAVAGLLAGLALVWWPLRNWLGQLDRVQALGEQLQQGAAGAISPMRTDQAPLEFQRTFEVLNRVAASLQTERAQAAVTLASIDEGVATLNLDGEIVLANPVMGALLGQPSAGLLGQRLAQALPPLGFQGEAAEHWRGRRFELPTAIGGQRVLEASLSPVLSERGEPAGWVLALRDVSEQQALEHQLRAELESRANAMQAMSALLDQAGAEVSRTQGSAIDQLSGQVGELVARLQRQADELQGIFSLSPDGFVSFDAQRRVRFISPAFALLTALADREVLGQDEAGLQALLQGRQADRETQRPLQFDEIREEARVLRMDWPMPRVLAFALHDGGGREISQLLHVRDVSQQFELDRLKSEFMTTAAHELRTPMTSIFGFSELLVHRELPPERQRNLLQRIHRQSQAMMAILNELLDLARIESRRAQDFSFEAACVQELVRTTVEDFGVPLGREAIALSLPEAPLWVRVDVGKFGQALRNLISNAYKYSPGGGVVALRVRPLAGGEVDIEVQDHGIGMTEEELARVTERFFRADKSGAIPGTGLGMAIVKEIVELMGGSLHMSSEPGAGTTVALRLRTLAQAPALAQLPEPAAASGAAP